jgi:D-methionine transport system ATP-binding protein
MGMIQLSDIHQIYDGPSGPVEALKGIDLTVAPGEVFGVIGRSGAGKSSLVRTINLLNRPVRGGARRRARLGAGRRRAAGRSQGIGVIFQHFNLLASRTVYDNVALPSNSRACVRRTSGPASAHARAGGPRAARSLSAQISGGRSSAWVSRALAAGRRCSSRTSDLGIDPETTLDPRTAAADQREFGLTVVLITHEMQVIKQLAQRSP